MKKPRHGGQVGGGVWARFLQSARLGAGQFDLIGDIRVVY